MESTWSQELSSAEWRFIHDMEALHLLLFSSVPPFIAFNWLCTCTVCVWPIFALALEIYITYYQTLLVAEGGHNSLIVYMYACCVCGVFEQDFRNIFLVLVYDLGEIYFYSSLFNYVSEKS